MIKQSFLIMILFSLLQACMAPEAVNRTSLNQSITTPGGDGNTSLPTDNGGLGNTTPDTAPPIVEIRNLVEPNIVESENYTSGIGIPGAGTYVRKMTLPKNYQGRLYIGGININSLSNRIVKVRFNFGYAREPITLVATVAKAPGMTPQTNIDVLVVDLRNRPFESIRLLYDLFDYKDYAGFGAGTTYIDSNRDGNLYCRGLRLEDDNTFNGQGACDGLDSFGNVIPAGEQCLYSYAKILDKGLTKFDGTNYLSTYPTLTQTELRGNGYYRDTADDLVKRCLPDANPVSGYLMRTDDTATGTNELIQFTLGGMVSVMLSNGLQNYVYEGPFKPTNVSQWQISGAALTGSKGLFAYALPLGNVDYGFGSMMYPRFGKMELNSYVENLSSATPLGTRTVDPFPSAGDTQWMDGCNIRVQNINALGEHVGSCNVTSSIQIIATDDNGVEFIVAETNDVVIQLTRSSVMSEQNGDVLFSNFRSCVNSSQCGASECCFNNRCWSNTLVSQCVETAPVVGNKPVGQTCTSDFECSSLCCNSSTGLCSVHNNLLAQPVLCNKPMGSQCIAKEWCQKQTVTDCYIVKTGTSANGGFTCAKRCYNRQVHGDCRQGICVPPAPGYIDPNDPSDPAYCNANTMDPPEF